MRDTDGFTRVVAPLSRLVLLHRIHARSAFLGGLRMYIIGSFLGEKRGGVWSYELTGGSREGMIDLSRWQHQTNCFKSITHDATYYYHKMHGLCILFKYRYHIRTIIIINWRFHARLALGSCGSQDLWGLSEWPASINEHGAIKSSSKSRGWTRWVRVNQTNPGTAIIIDHFLKSVTCLIIDNNYIYHIPRQRHISNYRFLSLSYKR